MYVRRSDVTFVIGSPYLVYVVVQEVRCNICYRLSLLNVGQEVRCNVCSRLSLLSVCCSSGGQM